jgi:hypothetical protein
VLRIARVIGLPTCEHKKSKHPVKFRSSSWTSLRRDALAWEGRNENRKHLQEHSWKGRGGVGEAAIAEFGGEIGSGWLIEAQTV